jgi:uncharacterized protein (DUF2336 family)
MSELQNAMATIDLAPAAVTAKPRISADAFRNLTMRLKKADVVVPNLIPVAPTVIEVVAIQPAAPTPKPVVVEIAPIAETPLIPVETLSPIEALLPVEPVAPIVVEPPSTPAITPALEAILPVQSVAEVVIALDPPITPAKPSPLEMILSLPEAPAAITFPPLPEYVPPAAVVQPEVIAPIVAAEVEVEAPIKFEENFKYVPEPGKPDISQNLNSDDETVKQEIAQRAAELALENIWRLMLAKPTSEDRITYLREAAEIHAADEEWNKPEPEHDLSIIAPASEPESIGIDGVVAESADSISDLIVPESLPVAEGQDLAELTRSLLDMMAAGNASGLPQERALAADTLLRLVPRLELKPLILLGQRLAIMDAPPTMLVSRLIRDPRVEVAGPLLADCVHITDKDLEQIIAEGEVDKLRMIGRRRKLSRPISDALIKSGDPSVVLTLVRNTEAEISHDGFLSLLVLCENHEELLAPLATRQDLAAPVAFELFWLAPAQLRRFILSRFLTDSETLTKILKITKLANAGDEGEVEPLSQHALLEALERAARGLTEVAAEELAGIMQLSTATVSRILADLQGEAIVVMLKAAAYPRSSMAGLLKRLQDAELPLISRDRDISELQSMFETLSFNKARILLTYWDWAQGKTGPYAPVN